MRLFLALLALVLPLAGCAGTCGTLPDVQLAAPSITIPPPVSLTQRPQIVPTGYAQLVPTAPTAPQYVQVPQTQAAPAYTSGYQWAPVPQAAPRSCP